MVNIYTLSRLQKARSVNTWFEQPTDYDSSPRTYAEQVVDNFIYATDQLNLTLCVSDAQFHRAICKLICQMYIHRYKPDIERHLDPVNKESKPRDWKLEYEQRWTDHIEYNYFNCEFWEKFWNLIPECELDSTFHDWRRIIAGRLPYFVARDASLLAEEGLLDDHEEDSRLYDEDEYDRG